MDILDNFKNFNLKEFIWNRYDPYGNDVISVGDVLSDIIWIVLSIIGIKVWVSGVCTFIILWQNPNAFISGVEFLIMLLAMVVTVGFIITPIIIFVFESLDGNIEICSVIYDKFMGYKLLKR